MSANEPSNPAGTVSVPAAAPAPEPVEVPETPTNDHWLPSKIYDPLKFLAQILLPAVGALYFGLSQIWHFPRPEDVIGTITVVDTFLGGFLAISKAQYLASDSPYDGSIDVTPTATGKTFSLTLNADPENLDQQKAVTFKVNS